MDRIGMVHNPGDDFDHPDLPAGHQLRRHVLYRIRAAAEPAAAGVSRSDAARLRVSTLRRVAP
jgi:hypothetical protein